MKGMTISKKDVRLKLHYKEKEMAQCAAYGSFMHPFSFTIIYDTSNQKKIQHYIKNGL